MDRTPTRAPASHSLHHSNDMVYVSDVSVNASDASAYLTNVSANASDVSLLAYLTNVSNTSAYLTNVNVSASDVSLSAYLTNVNVSNVSAYLTNISVNASDVTIVNGTTNATTAGSADSLLSKITMMLMLYFHPIIFIFGIVGNSVSFVVFLSEKMRRVSTNVYLAALSASSCVFLVAVAVAWTDLLGWKLMHYNGLCQVTVYLTYCSDFLCVWLVVCIAVENFVINFFLHKASTHCKVRRAICLVVLLVVISVLLYDFAVWTTGVISVGGNHSKYCSVYPQYQPVVDIFTMVDVVIILVLPSVLILALVIPTCLKNLSCRSQSPSRVGNIMLSRRERALLRVTRLLCLIIVSYVLFTAPTHINKLRHLVLKMIGTVPRSTQLDMMVVFIVQTLYYISFSMNFVYYLVWGKNFRKTFCHCFIAFYRLMRQCRRKLLPIPLRW